MKPKYHDLEVGHYYNGRRVLISDKLDLKETSVDKIIEISAFNIWVLYISGQ